MAESDPKKAERLVSFRKLERERASMEVMSARAAVTSAEGAVRDQEQLIEKEAVDAALDRGEAVRPEDIVLAFACVDAARHDLKQKKTTLASAEKTLGQKASVLLSAHKKVRQMEALASAAETRQKQIAKAKETKEIDDLAIHREARK